MAMRCVDCHESIRRFDARPIAGETVFANPTIGRFAAWRGRLLCCLCINLWEFEEHARKTLGTARAK